MRSIWLCVAAFLVLSSWSACSGEIYNADALDYEAPAAPVVASMPMKRQVRLSTNVHPMLDPLDVVLDGCRAWWPNDVDCVLTDQFDSTIHLVAVPPESLKDDDSQERKDLVNCVPDKDGAKILAISFWGVGDWIEIYTKCYELHDADGNLTGYDTLMATAVVTHEVGHQLGIWDHVPATCDPMSYADPKGRLLCGDAIMNAFLNLNRATGPTEVDDVAYELYAPYDHTNPPPAGAKCAFKMR